MEFAARFGASGWPSLHADPDGFPENPVFVAMKPLAENRLKQSGIVPLDCLIRPHGPCACRLLRPAMPLSACQTVELTGQRTVVL